MEKSFFLSLLNLIWSFSCKWGEDGWLEGEKESNLELFPRKEITFIPLLSRSSSSYFYRFAFFHIGMVDVFSEENEGTP